MVAPHAPTRGAGVIHNCSHPNDDDPNFRITEEVIFDGVLRYIDGVVTLASPKRLLYVLVAPATITSVLTMAWPHPTTAGHYLRAAGQGADHSWPSAASRGSGCCQPLLVASALPQCRAHTVCLHRIRLVDSAAWPQQRTCRTAPCLYSNQALAFAAVTQ